MVSQHTHREYVRGTWGSCSVLVVSNLVGEKVTLRPPHMHSLLYGTKDPIHYATVVARKRGRGGRVHVFNIVSIVMGELNRGLCLSHKAAKGQVFYKFFF